MSSDDKPLFGGYFMKDDGTCHGPVCCGQKMEDDGDCGEGCCDDYRCAKCGKTVRCS